MSNITTIILNNREFKLIGTAHVSRESIEEVRNTIREEKPDMVCVELDQARYNSITQNDTWSKLDLSKVFKERKGFLLIVNLVLAGFQRRLGNQLGVTPGEEMKTAIETAEEMKIPHSLCDREVHTTLRRAWARCSLWSKCKLLASLLASAFTTEKLSEQEIENLKKKNELDGMMSELADYLPGVKVVLIDERDQYLASKIWSSMLPPSPNAKPQKIVAVIGAGHMQGIITHLEQLASKEKNKDECTIEHELNELNKIPKRGIFSKTLPFIIPAIIVGLITFGFIREGSDIGITMILQWVLWNGSLAAIGAIIALGHPLVILVSFLGAPLTSLTPFIGVGIISGLVQIAVSKPRVSDVQDITQNITSIKGIYRNRITRALLVFFFSSLGSSIATFVLIPMWVIN
ncbi:MAG: TraB/GumN family protein [Treponema sp.]|jgi:pheromone shutdown-related protein TraB|nr:TraB/GumN family protein [Treponema sp.]